MSLITQFRVKDFKTGFNHYDGVFEKTGIYFDILLIDENTKIEICDTENETAIVIINGKGNIAYQDSKISFNRNNWIEHDPTVVHLAPNESVIISATATTKAAIVKTPNSNKFKGRVYTPEDIDTEHRGKDQLDNTCYRLVRLAFDKTIAPPQSKLVIGEVLNFPGKWSSYPPHYHAQPEIYYYEFSPDWGYGHGELGEDVYKIKHGDMLQITDSRVHSQTAAPGFHMYYLWTIRHPNENPYDGFTYIKPFEKMLD
jgi:5-deoxy-glucuronate isomerase